MGTKSYASTIINILLKNEKTKKYNTVGIVPKSNKMEETGKMDTHNTHIRDFSHSGGGKGTLIKSGSIKLVHKR